MTAETTTPPAAAPSQATGPLFYQAPVPLRSDLHAAWRLVPDTAHFAADTNAIPAVIGEFGSLAQHYPIIFTGKDAMPLVAVGLAQRNLFVADGVWDEQSYVPAYVRRYPFVFMQAGEQDEYVLALDSAAKQVNQGQSEDGVPLFQDGKVTEIVDNAMRFCGYCTREHDQTRRFTAALIENDLLIDRNIDVTLADGRQMSINGFQVVDVEKFAALPDATVVAWHRSGWLALVHHHLSSLARFSALVSRQSALPADA